MKSLKELNTSGEKLDQLALQAINYGQAKKYDSVQISNNCSVQKSLVAENKEFSLANSFETASFELLVHHQQKSGTATINTENQQALNQTIDAAATLASYSLVDEFLDMADQKIAPAAKKIEGMFDDSLASMELQEIYDGMVEVLDVLTRDKRIALERFEVGIDLSRSALINSKGVRQSEYQSVIHWQWMGMAIDGEQVSGFDYDGGFSYKKADFLKNAKREAAIFVENLVKLLNPIECPTYKGAILLTPRAVGELITENILYHAGGRSIMDKRSRWCDALGKKVISDKITLVDMPHHLEFSGATAFDQDGVPTQETTIIKDGVFHSMMLSCYSAKKLGTKTNGMAGGPFALSMCGGKEDYQAMLNARNELLVVDRFSGNVDPILGDFSGVAKNSYLYRYGKEVGPVGETMIAGNFFDVIQNVLAVSKETLRVFGASRSPWMVIDGVSVTGNE